MLPIQSSIFMILYADRKGPDKTYMHTEVGLGSHLTQRCICTVGIFFSAGTCVNNTSVMMFKKGGFEVSPVVYPVAIKVSIHLSVCLIWATLCRNLTSGICR